jgi:phage tail protein X
MITADSRYTTATVVSVPTATGPRQTVVPLPPEDRIINYTSYLVTDTDRIDLLAFRFLGQATLWWMIADANPEITDWFRLGRGTVVRIPHV